MLSSLNNCYCFIYVYLNLKIKLRFRTMKTYNDDPGVLFFFGKYNENLKHQVTQEQLSKSTLTKYKTIRNRVSEFISDRYNEEDLEFSEIRRSFANDFHDYLVEKKRLANNTAVIYIEMVAKIFRIAQSRGLLDFDITDFYSHQKVENYGVDYLTIYEMDDIEEVQLETVEEKTVRDLFMFSCYTGLSYERLKELNVMDDLEIDEEGTYWVYVERGYFRDELVVPLNIDGEDIIDQYEEVREANDSVNIFPISFPNSIQSTLLEIACKAGIKRHIDFNMAQYTFALTYAVRNNFSTKLIRNILGNSASMKTKHLQEQSASELVSSFDISNDVYRN